MQKLKIVNLTLIFLLLTSLAFHVVFGLEGKRQIAALENEIFINEIDINGLTRRNALYEMIIDRQSGVINEYQKIEPEADPENEYLGKFEITYYTSGPESTGKSPGHPAYGITASGTTAKEGQTIAADWNMLPPGTTVYIEGIGERIVEDTGGTIIGNCIDVYVADVETALQGGRHMADVYVLEEEK